MKRTVVCLLVSVVAAGAAYGGSPAGAGIERSAVKAAASDPGVTDSEVRVGLVVTLSGAAGVTGKQAVGAVDSHMQMVNDAGGVGDRTIKVITYDDKGDQGERLQSIRRLYEEDKVVALLLNSTVGAQDYIERNKIPTFIIGAEPEAYSSKYPHIHPIAEHYLAFSQQLPIALKKQGVFKKGMKVAILYDPQNNGPYLEYIKAAWTIPGAEVVSVDPLPPTTTDCSALVLKVQDLDIDFWDFEGANFWFVCMLAAQRAGFKPTIGWGSYATSLNLLIKLVGPYSEGTYSGNFVDKIDGLPRTETEAHREYIAALEKYHPEVADPDSAASPVAQSQWLTSKLFVDALRHQKAAVTRAGINKWVNAQRNWDPGVNPPILSLASNCKTGTGKAWFGQWHWQDGTPSLKPITGYLKSPYEKRYGGKCYLTKIADKVSG